MAKAEKPPIRITKQRAEAVLEAAGRGVDEWQADLEDNYGIVFYTDGTMGVDEEKFRLLTESEQKYVTERLGKLTRAVDSLAILRRRYG